MSNIVIKAENISKYYRLGQINNGTLYADIQSWFARKLGKEDPHSKIAFRSRYDKDGFWALKDIDFEIKQGDRVGIIGHNGAGKSTLLKIISEITTPTTGNIYIKGRIASLLEVGTGFHPEMTGRENIYMNGAILGMKRAEITSQLDAIIEFSELEKYIDTPVKRYSSGMYVRLAFAVAAHLQSEILIADEVLAVGDATFQEKALGKMNELSTGEGRTVLFVTHNMEQIKKLCNKGIVLDKGQVVRQDDDIQKSIDWYLGNNINDKRDLPARWKNNNCFFDENFTPIDLYIQDKNGNLVSTDLKYQETYFINLIVHVKTVSPLVKFGIVFFKHEEWFLLSKTYEGKMQIGENHFVCELPAKTLLPEHYQLAIGAVEDRTRFILHAEDRMVSIQINILGEDILEWKKQ